MTDLHPWKAGILALAALGAACSNPLAPKDLVGSYTATTFTVQRHNAALVDVLGLGATLTIELHADATTSGHFTMPVVPGFSTEPLDESLDGTYTVHNDVIQLTPGTNTFISTLFFQSHGNRLSTYYTFVDGNSQSGNVSLELTRQ